MKRVDEDPESSPEESESELRNRRITELALLAKEDPAFWGELSDLLLPQTYKYAIARVGGNVHDAEDLTGAIIERAFRNFGKYNQMGGIPFNVWFFRLAGNVKNNRVRAIKRHPVEYLPENPADLSNDGNSIGKNPEDIILENEKKGAVFKAIALLPSAAQRAAIVFQFGAELSLKETAAVMGKNEGTIKTLRHRALGNLRKLLTNWA